MGRLGDFWDATGGKGVAAVNTTATTLTKIAPFVDDAARVLPKALGAAPDVAGWIKDNPGTAAKVGVSALGTTLSTGGRLGVLGVETGAKALSEPMENAVMAYGAVNPVALVAGAAMKWTDEKRARANHASVAEKITGTGRGRDYGYGSIAYSTDNKWVDRGIGLGGDLALDPTTYLGLGVGGTAKSGVKIGAREVLEAGTKEAIAEATTKTLAEQAGRAGVFKGAVKPASEVEGAMGVFDRLGELPTRATMRARTAVGLGEVGWASKTRQAWANAHFPEIIDPATGVMRNLDDVSAFKQFAYRRVSASTGLKPTTGGRAAEAAWRAGKVRDAYAVAKGTQAYTNVAADPEAFAAHQAQRALGSETGQRLQGQLQDEVQDRATSAAQQDGGGDNGGKEPPRDDRRNRPGREEPDGFGGGGGGSMYEPEAPSFRPDSTRSPESASTTTTYGGSFEFRQPKLYGPGGSTMPKHRREVNYEDTGQTDSSGSRLYTKQNSRVPRQTHFWQGPRREAFSGVGLNDDWRTVGALGNAYRGGIPPRFSISFPPRSQSGVEQPSAQVTDTQPQAAMNPGAPRMTSVGRSRSPEGANFHRLSGVRSMDSAGEELSYPHKALGMAAPALQASPASSWIDTSSREDTAGSRVPRRPSPLYPSGSAGAPLR